MILRKMFMGCLVAVCGLPSVYAGGNSNSVVYIGAGPGKTGSATVSDATPITLGYMNVSSARASVWGLDIAREGTLLDSTWGQDNSVSESYSFNILIGANLYKTESSRIDAAFLAGFREDTESCPSSYLGFQCYADATPDSTYAFNYGAVLALTYRKFMLGARVTGESTQALIGVTF